MDYDFKPDWGSSPGDTIKDILEEEKLTVHDLSDFMKLPVLIVEDILEGRRPITHSIAIKLSQSLGGNAAFWKEREKRHRNNLEKISTRGVLDD